MNLRFILHPSLFILCWERNDSVSENYAMVDYLHIGECGTRTHTAHHPHTNPDAPRPITLPP